MTEQPQEPTTSPQPTPPTDADPNATIGLIGDPPVTDLVSDATEDVEPYTGETDHAAQ